LYGTNHIYEDFWKCTIEEFINEYDRFESMELKQSYFLFWTNLINISSLLCRIKTCNYYFIKINKTYENPTPETSNEEIINFRKNPDLSYSVRSLSKTVKYIFTSIDSISSDITSFELKGLCLFLIDSLNCNYDNIKTLYINIICYLSDKEQHEETLESRFHLLSGPSKICSLREEFNDCLLYLSLSLANEFTYARSEYTRFACTFLNPVFYTDKIAMSIGQLIGHDLIFHNAMNRKQKYILNNDVYQDDTRKSFKKILSFITIINNHKNEFLAFINRNTSTLSFRDDELFKTFYKDYMEQYKIYDYHKILSSINYLFHERGITEPFSITRLIYSLNNILCKFSNDLIQHDTNDINMYIQCIIFIYMLIFIKNLNIETINFTFNDSLMVFINELFIYLICLSCYCHNRPIYENDNTLSFRESYTFKIKLDSVREMFMTLKTNLSDKLKLFITNNTTCNFFN
jgi:hypothetical protein